MSNTFIISLAVLGILGGLLAVVLYFVAQKFKVEENPLIDEAEACLPGANCGGCGFAGCRALAEACVKQAAEKGNIDIGLPWHRHGQGGRRTGPHRRRLRA